MQQEPTFLMCVGATKAGTSWLFDRLSAHEDCHLRTIKELHYFDMLYRGNFDRYVEGFTRRAQGIESELPALSGGRLRKFQRRLQDVTDWLAVVLKRGEDLAAYRAYLTQGLRGRRLVADVTPGYALLPEDSFRRMATVGADTRFLYLLRDPLARLWSNARMVAFRRRGADYVADCVQVMDQMLTRIESGETDREDYAGTITRLKAAVSPARLLVMFQDEMLSRPGFARLCDWLGIRPADADFDKRVLEGKPLPLPGELRARALAALRPQYDFVARLFPALPESWRKTLNEVHA